MRKVAALQCRGNDDQGADPEAVLDRVLEAVPTARTGEELIGAADGIDLGQHHLHVAAAEDLAVERLQAAHAVALGEVEEEALELLIAGTETGVWVGDEQILADLEETAAAVRAAQTKVFLSLGAAEGNRMLSGFEALTGVLESWPTSGLQWAAAITEGADHGTNPLQSYPVAARWCSGR